MNEPDDSGTGAPRVLIVDDDAAQLKVLGTIISSQRPLWNVRTHTADGTWIAGLQADPAAQLGEVDLLLVDHRLGSGAEADSLLPALRAHAPTVIMSGSLASLDIDGLQAAGAAAVVAKPFNLDEAAELLRRCDAVLG